MDMLAVTHGYPSAHPRIPFLSPTDIPAVNHGYACCHPRIPFLFLLLKHWKELEAQTPTTHWAQHQPKHHSLILSLSTDSWVEMPHLYTGCLLPAPSPQNWRQSSVFCPGYRVCMSVRLSADNVNPTRMWANAQRDGRPAEHRWRPLFNAAKFGWRSLLDCCAVTLPRCESRWN